MKTKRKETYFAIEKKHLKEKKIFPFHVHVYNPATEVYTLFLPANEPLNEEKSNLLDFVEEKGGEIAINFRQRKTFLRHFNYYDLDIPSLVPEDMPEVEKQRLAHIHEMQEQNKQTGSTYKVKDHILEHISQDDFMPMITSAKNNILALSVRLSHTVSLARFFAMTLMDEDTHLNRVVSLCYFTAQSMGITEEQEIGELCCAAFLSHIGLTQMDYQLNQKAQLELKDQERKKFEKHPGFSLHLIRKSQAQLSKKCLRIIEQHHERTEGQGFPQQKKSPHIEPLALILGACAHIFEYSSGQVTGTKIPLAQIINNIENENFSAGLEFGFSDTIIKSLIHNLSVVSIQDKAA